jgi:hypothetical protein
MKTICLVLWNKLCYSLSDTYKIIHSIHINKSGRESSRLPNKAWFSPPSPCSIPCICRDLWTVCYRNESNHMSCPMKYKLCYSLSDTWNYSFIHINKSGWESSCCRTRPDSVLLVPVPFHACVGTCELFAIVMSQSLYLPSEKMKCAVTSLC